MNPNVAGGGIDGVGSDNSEPERGDLPQKSSPSPPPQPPASDEDGDEDDILPASRPSAAGGIDPYEYDYEENHRLDAAAERQVNDDGGDDDAPLTAAGVSKKRRKRSTNEDDDYDHQLGGGGVNSLSHHLEGVELEMAEQSELPYISSPHICFSTTILSTTTCKSL